MNAPRTHRPVTPATREADLARPALAAVLSTTLAMILAVLPALVLPSALAAQEGDAAIPRTEDGRPDLQGNWTNATLTPIQRPEGLGKVLTPEQVRAMESERAAFIQEDYEASDPDREAPPEGGVFTGNPLFDAASGGTGGYNQFYIDAGDRIAVYDGELRSSLVTIPESGRIPPLTAEAREQRAAQLAASERFGEYDNPENRPLAERCIVSFGSNAGPPMLPNYFYNNNYTIVQTPDHIVIMTEMVHDARIIPIGEKPDVADDIRPWFGVSWARWEGDTLVIETTNLSERQMNAYGYLFPGASENVKITERLTRVDRNTINYEFLVEDPDTYTEAWGGQVPFRWLPERVYEYACHEGNYALSNVLSGARAQEREQAGSDREDDRR